MARGNAIRLVTQGEIIISDPASSRPVHIGTFTCAHCNRVKALHDQRGNRLENVAVKCMQCSGTMCVPCAERTFCAPFEAKLVAIESGQSLMSVLRR